MPPEHQPDPFATALRAAIAGRGLGLHRIRERLRTRGITISAATLSYWQSGRSRPERHESLTALHHLEEVLEVPRGSLTTLLGPPRPRGPHRLTDPPDIDAFWPAPTEVAEALTEINTSWDTRLTRLSQHDTIHIGPHREELTSVSRQVLRANADGPDRWVVILHLDEHDHPLPEVRPLRHCTLGRTSANPSTGLLTAELLFPKPLRRNETIITEHELRNHAPHPTATNYERKFRLPVREYVLEVRFDPTCPPATITRRTTTQTTTHEDQVHLDELTSVHGVATDFGPGTYGFHWTWP
ncbi:helix-turn-helix transcriptional regulator [Crossiella sp. CA-258035]|uniref:helix-turn-helix domain-containing protein n=1 Tax=Crossiella sp. CA-258035 TaxID=2981138 RepID=UPI0024BCC44A|nr:helix-turn-helix transcriptional regulator [Crossiella sp. CA-258035]WHT19121.1 helix-turn-helix transcriptional regulator [Crossiella sp. CA-258035]